MKDHGGRGDSTHHVSIRHNYPVATDDKTGARTP